MEYKIQEKTCKRCCGAGIKSRGAELNFIPEPKLRTEAPSPAPLYLLQSSYRYILKEIFRKIMVAEEVLCKLLQF